MTAEEAKAILRADKFCQTECKNKNCGSCNIYYSTKEWETAIDLVIADYLDSVSKPVGVNFWDLC